MYGDHETATRHASRGDQHPPGPAAPGPGRPRSQHDFCVHDYGFADDRTAARHDTEHRDTEHRDPAETDAHIESIIARAVRCATRGAGPCFTDHVHSLLGSAQDTDWPGRVDRILLARLDTAIGAAWRSGWQPADVARHTERLIDARHRRLVGDLMAAQLRAYAPATIDELWHDQLAAIDAAVWWTHDTVFLPLWARRERVTRAEALATGIRVLVVLATLPRLEALGPLPGTARRPAGGRPSSAKVDEKMLARVRALLAKAEATTYPAEAETFTTAAQAMMARHSIDLSMIKGGPDTADRPGGRRLPVDAPYPEAKALLLQEIAQANRCRVVWSRELSFSTVFGYPADVGWVEMLYTSLLIQASAAVAHAGARTDRSGRSRTRSFRQSFLQSFAVRIGERLSEATGAAVAQAGAETGRDLLPVLAARSEAVDAAVAAVFPTTVSRANVLGRDREGWISGRAAADLATLGERAAVRS